MGIGPELTIDYRKAQSDQLSIVQIETILYLPDNAADTTLFKSKLDLYIYIILFSKRYASTREKLTFIILPLPSSLLCCMQSTKAQTSMRTRQSDQRLCYSLPAKSNI